VIYNTKNSAQENFHIPVMVKEVIAYLLPNQELAQNNNKEPMYIDATIGGGGHTQAVLENISKGIVVGLDCDIDAVEFTKNRLKQYSNLFLYHTSYTNIDKIANEYPHHYVQGVLFDLGVSAFQITTPTRGFTYNTEGPLDMRFNQVLPSKIAKEIIHNTSLNDLRKIFFEYGEERYSNKIAARIFLKRNHINTTTQLAEIIREVTPPNKQNKTLSRIFQSLRIVVNHELENIKTGLEKAINLLTTGARIVVISYHSLEDRIIKQTFRYFAEMEILKILTKKPLRPELTEIVSNSSARSARLRAAERI